MMQLMEYATLSYRTGEREGWYLGDQLIGSDVVALLDRLTQDGWKLAIIGTTFQLARPRRQGVSRYLTRRAVVSS